MLSEMEGLSTDISDIKICKKKRLRLD